MKTVRHFLCVCIAAALLGGCGNSTPVPIPTADGKWTYTTADGKIKVNFELTVSSSGAVEIKNTATITVTGVSGAAAGQINSGGQSLPNLGIITINANDAALTYPHTITFGGCIFVSATNKIEVASGSYVIFPAANTVNFSAVSIVRQ